MFQDRLMPFLVGGGSVRPLESGHTRLSIPGGSRVYADAQMDDYQRLSRKHFPWRPPLTLRLRARASHPTPVGTLGFGFWNDPFSVSLGQGGAARRIPALPQALWYFYGSKENDLALEPQSAPHGWKATSLFFPPYHPLIAGPIAAMAFLLLRMGIARRRIIDRAFQTAHAKEKLLSVSLADWHEYTIQWTTDAAKFIVDNQMIFITDSPPQGPLGFVVWIDNQYAVLSRRQGIRFGIIPTVEEQWLDIADLEIDQ